MTIPVLVSGEDQPDGRINVGAEALDDLLCMLGIDGSERPEHGGRSTGETLAAAVVHALDAADRAAGIRRVTEDEAIERAARRDFGIARMMNYGHGPTWDAAPETKRAAARARVAELFARLSVVGHDGLPAH